MGDDAQIEAECLRCGKLQEKSQVACDECGGILIPPSLVYKGESSLASDRPRATRRKRPRSDDDTQVLELPPEVKVQMSARSTWRLTSGVVSSAGILRRGEPDEDSVLCIELSRILESDSNWFGFYAVADGMGGQEAGEVASRLALEALSLSVLETLAAPWLRHEPLTQEEIRLRLSHCVESAHQRVKDGNEEGGRDMGTTLTAALVLESMVFVLNVGDSRVYLYRSSRNELLRVSRDQSLVQQLVEAGEIADEDVYSDPRRNIILSSLGGENTESGADFYIESLEPGDKLLLCSDGLWEMIRDNDLLRVIDLKVDPQQCAEDLATLACINGGADNVSAIVVEKQSRKRI